MLVSQNNGAKEVVVKSHRTFIEKVYVGVADIFKFRKAQCLFGDCMAYNILFGRRETVREEGDQFDHQIGCAPEGCGAQGFVEEGDGHTLILLGNLDMNGPHNFWCLGCAKGVVVRVPAVGGGEPWEVWCHPRCS